MLLPKFNYHEPETLDEACRIMEELSPGGKLLAGGTDLIVNMRKGSVTPDNVVSIGRLPELIGIDESKGFFEIGAREKVSEIADSDDLNARFQALRQGANALGSPLIRNLATIGGNLANASPAADLAPPLMAYGARVRLKAISSERTVPLEDFFLGPGKTAMEPGEILTHILLEESSPHSGAAYLKIGIRKALAISIINVASFIELDESRKRIKTARVVLGAVGPTPLRAVSAEKALEGEKPGESLFARAGAAAARVSKPIDDLRGSAGYRRDMADVLTRKTLAIALERAKKNIA